MIVKKTRGNLPMDCIHDTIPRTSSESSPLQGHKYGSVMELTFDETRRTSKGSNSSHRIAFSAFIQQQKDFDENFFTSVLKNIGFPTKRYGKFKPSSAGECKDRFEEQPKLIPNQNYQINRFGKGSLQFTWQGKDCFSQKNGVAHHAGKENITSWKQKLESSKTNQKL